MGRGPSPGAARLSRLRGDDEPGGWAVRTAEANGGAEIYLGAITLFLRASALLAALGAVLGALALPVARFPARRAELLATLGIVLAAVPIAIAYERTIGLLVIGAAVVAPWIWFVRWGRIDRRVAVGALAVGGAMWAGWLALRIAEPVAGVAPRNVLGVWVLASTVLLVIVGGRVTPRRVAGALASIQLVDIAVLAAALVVAVVLANLAVNVVLVAAVVILPLVLLVGTRQRVARGLDRVLLAELREREALRATEDERARLAREIHDDPLQRLAGVIRDLESQEPNLAAATASLRDVATQLRGVATELHPPILDDLGLVPAIEGAARGIAALPVTTAVIDHSGFRAARRPPADVEAAAYRIVQEALANAVRHADASRVGVAGEVGRDAIDLAITDDGRGIDDEAVAAAQRDGHLGIASMRGRAAAIGADLTIEARPGGGTTVTLRWRR